MNRRASTMPPGSEGVSGRAWAPPAGSEWRLGVYNRLWGLAAPLLGIWMRARGASPQLVHNRFSQYAHGSPGPVRSFQACVPGFRGRGAAARTPEQARRRKNTVGG